MSSLTNDMDSGGSQMNHAYIMLDHGCIMSMCLLGFRLLDDKMSSAICPCFNFRTWGIGFGF